MKYFAIVFALMAAPLLRADETTGAIRGTVTDQSKAAIPKAKIELVNADTGQVLTQQTGAEGGYIFNLIRPGNYSLRASVEGFQTHTISGVVVEVNKTTQVDITLQVGAVAQNVEVSASAIDIDIASARVSTNVDEKFMEALPNAERNPLAMAELAPGVSLIRPGSQVQNIDGTTANVNGLRRNSNVFYLDGSDNSGAFRNSALQFPNPDAVQEVQVSTATTSAEFGKQPGGVFNVITKSGTNEVHGSGFFVFRNEALNANQWNRNRSGVDRQRDRLQQAGGTIGGPIRRNKTFFFTSYQHYFDHTDGYKNSAQVPTPAMLQGDFSQFTRQLIDPDSGVPFAGNRIPANRLDPVGLKLAQTLLPTVSALGQRLSWSYRDKVVNNELLVKGDHNFNERHMFMVSWLRTFGDVLSNTASSNALPSYAPNFNDSHQDTISARHTWIMSPSRIMQIRFAAAKHVSDNRNQTEGKTLADFGAKWPVGQEGATPYLPQFTVADGFIANLGPVNYFEQFNFRLGATLTWIRGNHNIKFGAETQRMSVIQLLKHDRTQFTFDGRATSNQGGVGVFGFSMADFLMGRAATFQQSGVRNYNLSNWSNYFFLQDEWRITRRLTLSPGLRYEFYAPPSEANGRASAYVPGHQSDLYPKAPVGIAFQGDRGIPSGFHSQDWNNVAPRLGLAWDPFGDGKTAVRAGFGVYYSYQNINIPMWNSERTPWDPAATGGNTTSMVDPWGTSRSVIYSKPPTPFTGNPNDFKYPPRIAQMIQYDLPYRTPYTTQWSLSVQRQILKSLVLQTGYVGNRGFNFDQILEGNLPVFTSNATLNNIESRRSLADFGTIEVVSNRSRNWYDAFQMTADLRFSRSFRSRLTYVFSKSLAVADEARGQGFTKTATRPAHG
ncbi:MAG: carboxypeptidase regulatory-like domain-containing protein, partial [Acidobacteria bacterium]|nr:carboxypeptidase regulatory-like domain-containing protein [Acidobacteriota bacterium]